MAQATPNHLEEPPKGNPWSFVAFVVVGLVAGVWLATMDRGPKEDPLRSDHSFEESEVPSSGSTGNVGAKESDGAGDPVRLAFERLKEWRREHPDGYMTLTSKMGDFEESGRIWYREGEDPLNWVYDHSVVGVDTARFLMWESDGTVFAFFPGLSKKVAVPQADGLQRRMAVLDLTEFQDQVLEKLAAGATFQSYPDHDELSFRFNPHELGLSSLSAKYQITLRMDSEGKVLGMRQRVGMLEKIIEFGYPAEMESGEKIPWPEVPVESPVVQNETFEDLLREVLQEPLAQSRKAIL